MSDRLEDLLTEHLNVVFCGINPGKGSAALGLHFANRSNRFWRTLHLSGFTPHEIRPQDGRNVLDYHCGLTTLVERPTASAGELARHEFNDAAAALEQKIRRWQPRFVAFWARSVIAPCPANARLPGGYSRSHWAAQRCGCCPTPAGAIWRSTWSSWCRPISNCAKPLHRAIKCP